VRDCLTIDPASRPTAAELLRHSWLERPHFVPDPESPTGGPKDLLPQMQKAFNAKKTFRKAVIGMMAMKRMTMLPHITHEQATQLGQDVRRYKQESELEKIDADQPVQRIESDPSAESPQTPKLPTTQMERVSLNEARGSPKTS
jgi:calcium/calmodulin-dependent protein kinase I